jgi:predicted ArsR family transcriptional regulator
VKTTRAENRFFESTRGRVISLLRRSSRTVDEMAGELRLTDNAIRTHLATLERDGLVTQGTPRRGVGKPAFTYTLTPEADRLFPKAYGALLQQLLQILGERLPREEVAGALREVGHRVAEGQRNGRMPGPAGTPLSDRVDAAIAVLGDLGGLAEAEETEDGFLIRGYSCPLANAVEGHPDSCLMAETLLSDLIGVPVHQVCDQGTPPRCRFEVSQDSRQHADLAPDREERAM